MTRTIRRRASADAVQRLLLCRHGPSDEQQAFVKNVFEKMTELEEELDWTEEAWKQDDATKDWLACCSLSAACWWWDLWG